MQSESFFLSCHGKKFKIIGSRKYQTRSPDGYADSDETTPFPNRGSNSTRQISAAVVAVSINGSEMPFSKEEDKKILNFIIDNNFERDVDRIVTWWLMRFFCEHSFYFQKVHVTLCLYTLLSLTTQI